jgi:hypothetical protein
VERVPLIPQHEQRTAPVAPDPERAQRLRALGRDAGHGPRARQLGGDQREGVRGRVATGQAAIPVAEERELADHQVHHLVVVHRPRVLGREIPVRGPAHAVGQRQHGAGDKLAAADAPPPGLQLGRAAGQEHR